MINEYFLNGIIIFIVLYSSFGNLNMVSNLLNNKIIKLILMLLILLSFKIHYTLCMSFVIFIILLYENKNYNKKKIDSNIVLNSIIFSNIKNIK